MSHYDGPAIFTKRSEISASETVSAMRSTLAACFRKFGFLHHRTISEWRARLLFARSHRGRPANLRGPAQSTKGRELVRDFLW